MDKLIEQYKERKAQIAGAIMAEPKGQLINCASKIEIYEAQAELYDAMIDLVEVCKDIFKLTE